MPVASRILTAADAPLAHLARRDKRLAAVIARLKRLRVRGVRSPSRHMIETIVGQMLSSKAGDAIVTRMEALCGGTLTATRVAAYDAPALQSCGLSRRKAECIAGFARFVRAHPRFLRELETLSDDEAMKRLTALPGIGPWSAKMHLIFVLGRENVVPYEDGAFVQAYRRLYGEEATKENALRRARRWAPYASYAARLLYRALDSGVLDELP